MFSCFVSMHKVKFLLYNYWYFLQLRFTAFIIVQLLPVYDLMNGALPYFENSRLLWSEMGIYRDNLLAIVISNNFLSIIVIAQNNFDLSIIVIAFVIFFVIADK